MPWTSDDAERHTHKATTRALKEIWAEVANERLQRTGDEGRAIREAKPSSHGRQTANWPRLCAGYFHALEPKQSPRYRDAGLPHQHIHKMSSRALATKAKARGERISMPPHAAAPGRGCHWLRVALSPLRSTLRIFDRLDPRS